MKKFIKLTLLFPASMLLVACAAPQRVALSMPDRASIKSDHVVLNTAQREIAMQKNNPFSSEKPDPYSPMDSGAIVTHKAGTTPVGGGLIANLIVAGIKHHSASKSQKAMAPVRAAMGGFDYLHYFQGKLKERFTHLPWLKVSKQDLKYNIRQPEQDIVVNANQNTTLFIGTTYAMNSSFQRLEVAAYVKLDEKAATPNAKQKIKPLYSNNFFYIYRLKGPNNAKTNKRVWVADNAAFLKAKLRDAALRISDMIAMDINKPGNDPYPSANRIVKIRDIDGFKYHGKVVKQSGDIYEIALVTGGANNGVMYAVNADSILN